jgi:hypothetical protein
MNTRINYRQAPSQARVQVLSYSPASRLLPTFRRSPNKLKPASHSYLHRDSQAALIGIIFSLAIVLITAKVWLIRLLG